MIVKEIGEFGLLSRITAMLPGRSKGVIEGIGDDVAVLDASGPEYLLATCDIQVEGIHFSRDVITAYQLGRKVAAINVSDIAAMGGSPRWALVSLAIPDNTEVEYIEELYSGMRELTASAGAAIVGGNLSRMNSVIALDFTLLGMVDPANLILRSTARDGDSVLITGSPGESRAGLELVRRPELTVSSSTRRKMMERHLCPQPRLIEGQLLARSGLVSSMIDVSDGMIGDLSHICEASGKGAEIDAAGLPVSAEVFEVAGVAGADSREWVLAGGEDYELMFTARPEDVHNLQEMLFDKTGISCVQIGRITAETKGVRVLMDGKPLTLRITGWDHFA